METEPNEPQLDGYKEMVVPLRDTEHVFYDDDTVSDTGILERSGDGAIWWADDPRGN